jgi:hypothetical protein
MKNKAYHVEEKFEKKPDPNWLNSRIVFSHQKKLFSIENNQV